MVFRRFVLIPQLLLSLMVELLVFAFRLPRLLPELICTTNDVHMFWFCHGSSFASRLI
jgi:hypothetical protein